MTRTVPRLAGSPQISQKDLRLRALLCVETSRRRRQKPLELHPRLLRSSGAQLRDGEVVERAVLPRIELDGLSPGLLGALDVSEPGLRGRELRPGRGGPGIR